MRTRAALAIAALTIAAAPVVPGLSGGGDGGWFHVTFDATITQASRDAVVAAGGEGIAPLPANAYLAWFDDAPRIDGASVTARTPAQVLDPQLQLSGPSLRLVALVHEDGVDGLVERTGAQLELVEVRDQLGSDTVDEVYVAGDLLGALALAEDTSVLYVGPAPSGPFPEDERSAQMVAGNLEEGVVEDAGYEDWLAEAGVTGAGVNVTVVDSGIDPRHPDLAPALVGKVEQSQSPTGEPMDGGGHGTHVAGIVAGRGIGLGDVTGTRSANGGFLMGLGVAPGAGLVDINILGNTGAGPLCGGVWPPASFEPLSSGALALDSHVWNGSWQTCQGTGAGYVTLAADLDRLTRDGDADAEGVQPFTFVLSAGNSGAGSSETETRLTAPKEAKNLIVTASLDVTNGDQVSSFSSRGPAIDGRVVPTIAAPGGGVTSTRSTTASISCNTPNTAVRPDGLLYASCSGTSMAAPQTAGSVALITEWWRKANDGVDPSPAMAKALLVNSATDTDDDFPIPNRHEGWGRITLKNLFLTDTLRTYLDQSTVLTDPGQTYETTVEARFGEPLKVTLVYSDAVAVVGANPALVNDLDLVLVAPDGTTYLGNNFVDGWSVAGGARNAIDNTENVYVENPAVGTWTVRVIAQALPGDGVPTVGDDTDQDFALVIAR